MIPLQFDKLGGLVPVVVQDWRSGEVLMVAFMNDTAWEATRRTGLATYWSRSRKELWVKGQTSGHVQRVREIRIDCDADTVLLKVEQVGEAACHTGHRSCFHRRVAGDTLETVGDPLFDPREVYGR